jgi:hypothetical protein
MMTTSGNLPPKFQGILDDNEKVLWIGGPKFLPFILTGVPFLIVGLIWGCIDYFGFIQHMFKPGTDFGPGLGFIIPFFALHLFPFWGSILNMVRLGLIHGNTFYASTNKRLLLRTGFWGTDFKSVDYDKIQDLQVSVNPIENLLGVGTVRAFSGATSNRGVQIYDAFRAVENPYEVYRQIKQVSVDVKTDWNYPNALRPPQNPGYQTDYKPQQ